MQDDRNRLCRHIRAARSWLGQAERSLADEKDVQGDLKLMLAKAELQHAEERGGAIGSALRQFLPIATAGILAAVAVFFLHAGDRAYNETVPAPSQEVQSPPPPAPPPASLPAAPASDSVVAAAPSAGEPAEIPQPILPQESVGMYGEAIPPPAEASQYSPADIPAQAMDAEQLAPEIPSRDMQKLMQSAGKILREQ